MDLLIAGDVVPRENNINFFKEGKLDVILENGLDILWKNAEQKIFNLEGPITNKENKIKKNGLNLKISPDVINGLKKMDSLLVLANNHIMDYGEEGLNDTINILKNNNIKYIGVGKKKSEIIKNCVIKIKEKKVAIYNCCENEFSVATDEHPGANGCDLLILMDDIRKLKEENDYLIVIYHGGKEFYRYPSPYLRDICKKMIDCGADFITCQQSHCIGSYEIYKDRHIVYGQGNFIFNGYGIIDNEENNEYWNTSIIVDIEVKEKLEVKYIPIVKTKNGTRLANEDENQKILNKFNERSEEIKEDKFVNMEYSRLAKKFLNSYLQVCHGKNFLFRAINKLCFHRLTRKLYNEKSLLAILNVLQCETHRELFIEALKEEIYGKEK